MEKKEEMARKGEAREHAKREWETREAGEQGVDIKCKPGERKGK